MNEPQKKSHIKIISILVLIGFGAIAAVGIVSRIAAEHHLAKKTLNDAVPTVAVITAQPGAAVEEIVLPGTVQAWHEATVYARTGGYLKSWAVDIGAHVKEGDVLAEIDAPDLDAQFHQAQADLATAEANNDLAQLTAKRDVELRKTDSIAQQVADTAVATAAADLATVNSEKANLDHLQQEENFKHVVAPFDGTITERNTDVGSLVNGGNDGTSTLGQDLFHISQTDKLRVYVKVPENNAAAITPDMTVALYFPQLPQQAFTAKLARTADALDPVTRSLLIELEVDNTDGTLLAGGYTDAHFKLPTAKDTILLPVNALLFRDGMHVGVVKDNHIALTPVTLGRDYGKTVEIISGLSAGDQLVINPPDSLHDGQEVRVVTPKQPEDKK
jgi:RND family efflux transporter MFP subunit